MRCHYSKTLSISFLEQSSGFDVAFLWVHGQTTLHEFLDRSRGILNQVVETGTGTWRFVFNNVLETSNEIAIFDGIPVKDLHGGLW